MCVQAIKFGEFGKYMRNKRIKTQFQHEQIRAEHALLSEKVVPQCLKGVAIVRSFATSLLRCFVQLTTTSNSTSTA